MSNDGFARCLKYISSQWQNVTSGPLVLDRFRDLKIEIAVGFHCKILFQGKYAVPSVTTHYAEGNCKIDIYYLYCIKELFKKPPTVKGEYVSSVFICPK